MLPLRSFQTPLSFTQQLQRHSRHNSRHQMVQSGPVSNSKYSKGSQKHSQILPNVDEYQTNLGMGNMSDLTSLIHKLIAMSLHRITHIVQRRGPIRFGLHVSIVCNTAAFAQQWHQFSRPTSIVAEFRRRRRHKLNADQSNENGSFCARHPHANHFRKCE